MVASRIGVIAASFAAVTALGAPAASAQYRYADDASPSVVVECGPGQRAVMEQRRINDGSMQVVARCVDAPRARRTAARSVARAPQRTKTKTVLMIAGSTATGAGIGGALKGRKGALVGAAIGGGSASIYEAARRR